jgi:hypothetical protein
MALTQVTGPYPIFTDLDGTPLDDGYLYIGAINDDPETNPIQVFFDANLTIPATQPIRTNNGYAYRNGTPALLYTGGEFSITIRNKRDEFVLYSPVGYGFDPAAVSASVVKNDFVGDGVETDFVLSASPSTKLATSVFINGVYQEKDSYIIAGNTLTFSIAPPLSSSIEVMSNETGVINSGNATAITYTASFSGATAQTVQTKLQQTVSVKDFGAVGDGVVDDTAALQAARDYVAAQTEPPKLIFPAGIYKYSVSPNWAITNIEVEAQGEVRLRYTGTGNAVIFDAGATAGDLCYNVNFGSPNRFHVDAPTTAANGVYVRSVHHSKLGFNVHGAGSSSAGLRVEFAVVTQFDVVVSVNEGGWYSGVKPSTGYYLTERLVGETCSYCYFPNPIVEGPTIGIYLHKTLGNVFIGGTSEGCSDYGVYAAPTAQWDRFYGTDFEVNGIADVYCLGTGLEFNNCDSYTLTNLGSGANRCRLIGGEYVSIIFDTGSISCSAANLVYNRFSGAGTITDGGSASEWFNIRNRGGRMYLTTATGYAPGTRGADTTGGATVSLPGAKLGDFAVVSFSLSVSGFTLNANVTAADTVLVNFTNVSGVSQTLGAGVLRVRLLRGVDL